MLSIAKFFVDIAKSLGISSGFITHGLLLILAVGITIPATNYFSKQNSKIESVPELGAKLDTIQRQITCVNLKFDRFIIENQSGHDSLNNKINKGFGDVQTAFVKSRELENQKFMYLDKSLKEKFAIPDSWVDEIINRISFQQVEKKNSPLYQLSSTQ